MARNLFGKRLLRTTVVSVLAIFVCVAGVQAAGEWKPSKPIQFVVPYAPGGGSDIFIRSIENIVKSEKLCPVPIMVVNQPGGGGSIGMTNVVQQRGNPHVLMCFVSLAAPLTAGKNVPTFRDMTNIANLVVDEQLIVVKSDSPFKTIEDIVAGAKKRPGEILVGGTMPTGDDRMCLHSFEKAASIKFRYVPFNSGGECITALLGGHVEMIWANPGEFAPQWEAKMVRPIAIAKEKRISLFPDVPTFREKGYDVTFYLFRGVAAPLGIPDEAVAFYENMLKRVTETPAWKRNYLDKYMLSHAWIGYKEYTPFIIEQEKLYRDFLIDMGVLK
jgi:putative tricarboxylic transport membrane protein